MISPHLLAMMLKQGIEGDDALLRLAQVRFAEAGLGAELYPGSPEQYDQQRAFCPTGRPCTIHLPRGINLLQQDGRSQVMAFAQRAAGRALGLIVHDHLQFAEQRDGAVAAFRDLNRRLSELPDAPLLFVEYAAGLEPDVFAELFEKSLGLRHVSACIDVSHVGIHVCRTSYHRAFPGTDICALKTSPDLPMRVEAMEAAVRQALPAVLALIKRLASLGRPLHFHLHDGHPLSTLSRYGVSDHLSFLQEIRLPCPHGGRQLTGGMFGPAGLHAIVSTARGLATAGLSFMIEVHPQEGRSPLEPHAALFRHWKDVTNAERMNHWLDMLLQNALLVREACGTLHAGA